MLAPSLPTASSWFSTSDGFEYSDKPTKWDTIDPTPEDTDFDLALRPRALNPALLTTQMQRACVSVEDVPFTTWGITQNEPKFQHNSYKPSIKFDVGASKNTKEFWVLYALSTYECNISYDKDPNTEDGILGSSDGFVKVFCETIRDACKNRVGSQPYDTSLQRTFAHEILHCFIGPHAFIGTGSSAVADPASITNQGIMRQGGSITAPVNIYILNVEQIKVIQKKVNPKPL
jgi:hypothetical protein